MFQNAFGQIQCETEGYIPQVKLESLFDVYSYNVSLNLLFFILQILLIKSKIAYLHLPYGTTKGLDI